MLDGRLVYVLDISSGVQHKTDVPTWNEISKLLSLVTQKLRVEWGIEAPPFGTLPSETLELAIDSWCLILAADLNAPLNPPAEVKPWILARLIAMSVRAVMFARNGDIPPPQLNPLTVRQFLIDEWRGCLREQWSSSMKHDSQS